jgi:tRNA(fMet)-specific endonuclease VapC
VYLLDTTLWIDLLRTNSPSIRRKLSAHSRSVIGLSIITACELQCGLERRAARHPHLRVQEQQLFSAILTPFDVFLVDHAVVQIYGRVHTVLENAGTAIGALDTFIAAQALSLGATLVTSNTKECARVPGLQIEDSSNHLFNLHIREIHANQTGNQKHLPRFWKKTKVITPREFISPVAPHLMTLLTPQVSKLFDCCRDQRANSV